MTEPIIASELRRLAGMDELLELALDLRWSWDHTADEIWRPLAPELWDLIRNPWVILQGVTPDKLKKLAADANFRTRVEALVQEMRTSREAASCFQGVQTKAPLTAVAYFSMEFMLGEALPTYPGGLGNVAGDQLKDAGDLGVPVVGVGLLYQEGYVRQAISADGSQIALYPINDPGQLPITQARDASGEWVRLQVHFPGYTVWVRTWQAQVGRLKLYLLDLNDPANPPIVRGITIFQPLFPRWPQDEVPIGHVTNGIHVSTWDSEASDQLRTKRCVKERWLGETDQVEELIRGVPGQELWDMRQASRHTLVEYARQRYARQLAESRGAQAGQILDPEVLTLGFARRLPLTSVPCYNYSIVSAAAEVGMAQNLLN